MVFPTLKGQSHTVRDQSDDEYPKEHNHTDCNAETWPQLPKTYRVFPQGEGRFLRLHTAPGTVSTFGPKSKSRLARLGVMSNTVKATGLSICLRQLEPRLFAVNRGSCTFQRLTPHGRVPAAFLVAEDPAPISWGPSVCAG
jgi:hypothetical protein